MTETDCITSGLLESRPSELTAFCGPITTGSQKLISRLYIFFENYAQSQYCSINEAYRRITEQCCRVQCECEIALVPEPRSRTAEFRIVDSGIADGGIGRWETRKSRLKPSTNTPVMQGAKNKCTSKEGLKVRL